MSNSEDQLGDLVRVIVSGIKQVANQPTKPAPTTAVDHARVASILRRTTRQLVHYSESGQLTPEQALAALKDLADKSDEALIRDDF